MVRKLALAFGFLLLAGTAFAYTPPQTCPAHNWFSAFDPIKPLTCTQPSFSDLLGTATDSQLAGPLVSALAVPAQFTISNPVGVGTATIGYTANSLAAHNFGTGIDLTGKLTGAQPAFSDLSGTLGAGQFTATTCTNQFVSALSNSGSATCTTDTLASAQHANQGTTTQVLHGNAAGNPSWAAVADADITPAYSGVGTCTNQFVSATTRNSAPTCTTDTLASAQHANQGTTTTVLHGNAAGNPSWASVADADLANGYSGTGACAANKFETGDNRNAVPSCAQPSFANLSGNPTATQLGITTTLLTGDLATTYTTTSLTPVAVDTTHLRKAVTIPSGSKLQIDVSASLNNNTAGDGAALSIDDGGTQLAAAFIISPTNFGAEPASLTWTITGDGLSHTITLDYQAVTAGTAQVLNTTTLGTKFLPVMRLTLMPSN